MNLINADALKIPVASGSVHFVCTSPPYYNAENYSHWDTYAQYLKFMSIVLEELYRVLCDGGRLAINVPQGYDRPGNGGYKTLEAHVCNLVKLRGFELRGHIIWHKLGMSPQGRGTAWGSWMSPSNPSLRDIHEIIIVAHKGSSKMPVTGEATIDRETFLDSTKSVWDILPVSSSWHPAPYPDEIPRRLIELYTYTNAIVLDPFAGSGTTIRVAEALNRIGIGCELSLEYCRRSDRDRIYLSNWRRGEGLRSDRKQILDGPLFTGLTDRPEVIGDTKS